MQIVLEYSPFWVGLLQIVALDVVLGADNAWVIALACRNLPPKLRRRAMIWGVAGAIILRVALTTAAFSLLAMPYLRLAGAVLLLWIGVRLVAGDAADAPREVAGASRLSSAIRTIVLADAVMSLDNVLAVAAAAGDDARLIVFGLALSITLVAWCSRYVIAVLRRFPAVVVAGGALLGWVSVGLAASDPAVDYLLEPAPTLRYGLAAAASLGVAAAGVAIARRRAAKAT